MKDQSFALHLDGNSYYASIEAAQDPDLRDKPLAVCGDPEARHGIVLTKSLAAKKMGVKTGMAIWQAKMCCPGLIIVPPDYPLYLRYTRRIRNMLHDLTDYVEPYGLDEAWALVRAKDYGEAKEIADGVRERMKRELGITASIGVSWNKVFAKLGSDYKKPDATTVITQDNYKDLVWTLPAADMLFVGVSSARKLAKFGVLSVGDLAGADVDVLTKHLGKNGAMLKGFALGQDTTPIMRTSEAPPEKSFGNSTTTPHDISTIDAAKCILYLLAECVAMRMRNKGFRARCVSVWLRSPDLKSATKQRALRFATHSTDEIARTAVELFADRFARDMPYRSVGLNCTLLEPIDGPVQLDLFEGEDASKKRDKLEKLDFVLDDLYKRFGRRVERGVTKFDSRYAKTDANKHINPCPGFYTGH
jgi:DNA polymerase-4